LSAAWAVADAKRAAQAAACMVRTRIVLPSACMINLL